MTTLVLRPLADAFLQVGVFVALMLAVFGYLQYRTGDKVTQFMAARWRSAPLFGALLGVIPGCGDAILLMPLYVRGTISFGTIVAALVATMGDAAFVIIAADPQLALWLHVTLLIAGIASGYLTDAAGIDPGRHAAASSTVRGVWHVGSVGAAQALPARVVSTGPAVPLETIPRAFWVLTTVGFIVALPVIAGVADTGQMARMLNGVDLYLGTGVAGTLIALTLVIRSRGGDECQTMEGQHSLADVLRHGARETASVTVWVAVAYLLTTWIIAFGGIDVAAVVGATGVIGVLIGTAIGLIPGCAIQVLLTSLYTTGLMPLPTLVANALSQDGDGLFPLIMMDRRSALVATVLTAVPALLLGGAALVLFG